MRWKQIVICLLLLGTLLPGLSQAQTQNALSSVTVIPARVYPDLNAAITAAVTAAGVGRATVWIEATTTTTATLAIAANIDLQFAGTGTITLGSGHTITYNGSTADWPIRQLFTGSGVFLFGVGASGSASPQWWSGAANGTNNFTAGLRAVMVATAGTSGIKTVALHSGIFLLNYETGTGTWVGIPAGISLKGDGYGTELRAAPASLSEGETGTLLAIEGSNITIEGVRINGNKAAITGLTNYGSVGIRFATAANNVSISNYWIHDLPASAATEAAGILTYTSGAVTAARLLHGETWNNNGTGVVVAGDYELGRNTSNVLVEDLSTHDNTWHGVRVSGTQDVALKAVNANNNTLDCMVVEFSLRVSVGGVGSRCRNGLVIKGDTQDVITDGIFWGNNKAGTTRGQIALAVGTWGAGQNTKALPRNIDLRRANILPTPGDYSVFLEHDATVTTFSDTGTFTIASNVITRSAGTWSTGLLPGQVIALGGFVTANNILVRIASKTSTTITIDPLYSTLANETGTGDEVVSSLFESIPTRVLASTALTYRSEDFADAATITKVLPALRQEIPGQTLISTLPPAYWFPGSFLSVLGLTGTGNQSPDAITATGTAATAILSSPSVLAPYGLYVVRIRYRPTVTGKAHDWRLRVFDGAVVAPDLLLTGDSTLNTSEFREADTLVRVGATPAALQLALLTAATSTLDVDWITVTQIPDSGARAATTAPPLTFQGWLTFGVQTFSFGVLPAHCFLDRVTVQTTQGFNSSGTDVVTVGYTGNTVAYSDAVDVDTVNSWTVPVGIYNSVARDLRAYYINGGTEPTQGRALVTVQCSLVAVSP